MGLFDPQPYPVLRPPPSSLRSTPRDIRGQIPIKTPAPALRTAWSGLAVPVPIFAAARSGSGAVLQIRCGGGG